MVDLYRTFLPMMSLQIDYPGSHPIKLGMQATISEQNTLSIQATGIEYIQLNNLLWSAYEPERGNASAINPNFTSILDQYNRVIALGAEPILIVHGCPAWARIPGTMFMDMANINSWLDFLSAVMERFPQVKYFQIWQEPDLTGGMEDYFGFWGNDRVTSYIHLLEESNGVLGDNRVVCAGISCADPLSRNFLNEIIASNQLDVIGLHYYPQLAWINKVDPSFNDTIASVRESFLGELWISEANYLARNVALNESFFFRQANWMLNMYGYCHDALVDGLFFYGWNNGWMAGSDLKDNPYATNILKILSFLAGG
jgi:hypothetical protein